MKKFDITLKDALSGLERAFCKIFLDLDIIEAHPLNTEFQKIEEKQADYIVQIKDTNHKKYILHIEFQTSNHKEMHIRMLRYLTELYKKYKLPVIQTVIYLGREKLNMQDKIAFALHKTKIEYQYELIDSKTLDCELFLNSNDSDMVILSILCDLENKDKSKFIKKILYKLYDLNKEDENQYKNFILKLETVSELRVNLKSIIKEQEKAMVADKISIEKLPSYEIGYEYGVNDGISQGISQGIREVVKLSLIQNFDIATISAITGLSVEEVKKIKKEMK